ncbi:MAG TPA: cytochrome P450, partial [Bradyrhizobium sp.]|nr:cytochrome P450 [Bradyrhizobium sp.]
MNANARELAANFDLEKLTPEFYADPYPTYRALREHEPIKRLPNGSWFLTRYDDLVSAYKTTKLFSSDKKKEFLPKYGNSLLYEHHTTSLVFNDPPAHTRVRRLIMGALSPRVPMEEREPLRDWSLAILGALEPVISAEAFARGNTAVKDFLGYLEILVERRRAKPGNPERDVLTRLIQGEDNGERLTSKELLHNCIFLLNAGHETTTNLIGNGLVALSGNAVQKKRLIDNPDLIKTAVEEILRFE